MMIGIGEDFPHTALQGVVGINPDKVIEEIYTDDAHSDWKIIFFYNIYFIWSCKSTQGVCRALIGVCSVT